VLHFRREQNFRQIIVFRAAPTPVPSFTQGGISAKCWLWANSFLVFPKTASSKQSCEPKNFGQPQARFGRAHLVVVSSTFVLWGI